MMLVSNLKFGVGAGATSDMRNLDSLSAEFLMHPRFLQVFLDKQLDKDLTSLKKRVKKVEQRGRSRTPGLKRLYKVGTSRKVESSAKASLGDPEDASKQGRNIAEVVADVDISLVHEDAGI
ncbi:hypothetical protein Tco_1062061 [Tanacetum coccineum]